MAYTSTPYDSDVSEVITTKSSWGPVSNLCAAIVGAGIICLPTAFEKSGLIGSILLLAVCGYGTAYSIDLLTDALDCASIIESNRIDHSSSTNSNLRANSFPSYESLAYGLCGPKTGLLVEISIIVFCFGVMVGYIMAVGDMLEDGIIKVFDAPISREVIMTLFWLVFMLPLSLVEKIDNLKYSSSFGMASACFFVFVTVYKSIESVGKDGYNDSWGDAGVRLWPESFGDVLISLSLMCFVFSCQVNVPRIYNELELDSNSLSYMKKVTRAAVGVCFIVYLFMGTFSYLNYGEDTDGDVLNNFCIQDTHDGLVVCAFVLLALKVCVAYPINVLPCCDATHHIVQRRHKSMKIDSSDKGIQLLDDKSMYLLYDEVVQDESIVTSVNSVPNGGDDEEEVTHEHTVIIPRRRQLIFSLLYSICSLLVALVVPNVSVVFSLVGGTSGALLGFILPSVFVIRLGLTDHDSTKKMIAYGLIIAGLLIAILSTAFTIYDLVDDEGGKDVCDA